MTHFFYFSKTKDPHKMLADLSLRFFKTEVNPARHIQGIINRGWISGQQVDPTYFKNLGKTWLRAF